jgi:hypothetical protein
LHESRLQQRPAGAIGESIQQSVRSEALRGHFRFFTVKAAGVATDKSRTQLPDECHSWLYAIDIVTP